MYHRHVPQLLRLEPLSRIALDNSKPVTQGILTDAQNHGWGARIRTWECRYQKPMPYHLATPQLARFLHGLALLRNTMSALKEKLMEALEQRRTRGYNAAHRDSTG